MTKTSCLDPVAANAYPSVTTGPRLLKILIARRDEYRDGDSDLLLAQPNSRPQTSCDGQTSQCYEMKILQM